MHDPAIYTLTSPDGTENWGTLNALYTATTGNTPAPLTRITPAELLRDTAAALGVDEADLTLTYPSTEEYEDWSLADQYPVTHRDWTWVADEGAFVRGSYPDGVWEETDQPEYLEGDWCRYSTFHEALEGWEGFFDSPNVQWDEVEDYLVACVGVRTHTFEFTAPYCRMDDLTSDYAYYALGPDDFTNEELDLIVRRALPDEN